MSISGYFADGLDLYSTGFGKVIYILVLFALLVSIACVVLGIIKLRKEKPP